jgi:hypothetical protein
MGEPMPVDLPQRMRYGAPLGVTPRVLLRTLRGLNMNPQLLLPIHVETVREKGECCIALIDAGHVRPQWVVLQPVEDGVQVVDGARPDAYRITEVDRVYFLVNTRHLIPGESTAHVLTHAAPDLLWKWLTAWAS